MTEIQIYTIFVCGLSVVSSATLTSLCFVYVLKKLAKKKRIIHTIEVPFKSMHFIRDRFADECHSKNNNEILYNHMLKFNRFIHRYTPDKIVKEMHYGIEDKE